jgi:hypothetical protein
MRSQLASGQPASGAAAAPAAGGTGPGAVLAAGPVAPVPDVLFLEVPPSGRGHPGPRPRLRPRPRFAPGRPGGRDLRPRFARNRGPGRSPVPVRDAPPSPSPICPESGTLPRPRPRFAEIGDQAVVLEYPKGVEGFAPGRARFGPITRAQIALSRHTHLSSSSSYLASDSAFKFDEEKARNDAFSPGSSYLLGSVGSS